MIDILGVIRSNPYIEASVIVVLSFIVAKLVLWFLTEVIEKSIKKRKAQYGSEFVVKIEHPAIILIILIGIQLALNKVSPADVTYTRILRTLITIVVTYMFIGISNTLIKIWRGQHQKENVAFHEEVMPLMRSLSKLALSTTAIIIILQLWGVEVVTLITSLGILGVILGFAFKDTMGNIFGGISLIMDDSLHKKDIIELDTGEKGEVVEINLRSTKMRTLDNNYLIIPNGLLSNSKFNNYAEPTTTYRITVDFSVAYGSDVDEVKEVVLGCLKGFKDILKFPARSVRFDKMADFSLNFKLFFFISNYKDMYQVKDNVTCAIYKALNENGIEIPFPTRTIYTKKSKNVSNKKSNSRKKKTNKK